MTATLEPTTGLHAVPDEDLLETIAMRMDRIMTIEEAIDADETFPAEAKPILLNAVALMRTGEFGEDDRIKATRVLETVTVAILARIDDEAGR
jgi:hypothetical protein